uniref:Ribosomal protein L5 n=1 Tax=Chloropicon primus TaxID=1764295 RepID=A0A4D6C476_9CHLO|nr:ribosomal protein L5 [Chloropicon primus]QBX98464.1 ribosomal protein L5 [Chloropicon primus]
MFHLSLKSLDFSQKGEKKISLESLPKIDKVIIRANLRTPENLPNLFLALLTITGQTPKTNYAKRPLAGFKLKKDQPLGLQLTLRGEKMNSFLKNLIFIVLPKFVDFSGVPIENLDSQGNLHFGSTQFFLWPQCEVSYEIFRRPTGFHITLISKGNSKKKPLAYSYTGLPLNKEKKD